MYKILIDQLIYSDKNNLKREALIHNFIYLFDTEPVPMNILIDPYIRHFQSAEGVTLTVNTFDLEMLQYILHKGDLSSAQL